MNSDRRHKKGGRGTRSALRVLEQQAAILRINIHQVSQAKEEVRKVARDTARMITRIGVQTRVLGGETEKEGGIRMRSETEVVVLPDGETMQSSTTRCYMILKNMKVRRLMACARIQPRSNVTGSYITRRRTCSGDQRPIQESPQMELDLPALICTRKSEDIRSLQNQFRDLFLHWHSLFRSKFCSFQFLSYSSYDSLCTRTELRD